SPFSALHHFFTLLYSTLFYTTLHYTTLHYTTLLSSPAKAHAHYTHACMSTTTTYRVRSKQLFSKNAKLEMTTALYTSAAITNANVPKLSELFYKTSNVFILISS